MSEMLKRRKEGGFTLIELMIVIAVIGILAVVLIPKVGTVKTQAKTAGLDTNVRMVQGLIQSRITQWNDSAYATRTSAIATEITNALITRTSEPITNPIDKSASALLIGTSDTAVAATAGGQITVALPTTQALLNSAGIIITSYDKDSAQYSQVVVKP